MAHETTTIAKPRRDLRLDCLRITAAVAVIWLHASAQHFIDAFPTGEWTLRMAYNALVRWCVPVFLMISGAVFLNPAKQVGVKEIFGKYVLRIAIALLAWSYIYGFEKINAGPAAKSFALLLKDPSHLWYLKMLIGIYIAIPVFRAIASHRATERYFIIVATITAFVIPLCLTIAKVFCNITVVTAVKRFIDSLYIDVVAGYSAYFLLGHYLYTYKPSRQRRRTLIAAALLTVAVTIGATYFFSHQAGKAVNWFINYLTITTMVPSAAVFAWFTNARFRIHARLQRCIATMSRLSFGVYLVHVLFIRTAVAHGIDSSWLHPAFFIAIYTIAIFILSLLTAWLLSKIPVVNRYLL